ncbi:PhoX family protein [Parafrankia elaeagni]|uniref:PhoX family protein n=1 Tax=Parafrankia elaeagni TaxID=222534 RepID=UPI00035DC4F7|nr:PhoX family phosphatase [Parafrankia elaeagni]
MHDDADDAGSNPTENPRLSDLIAARVSRRTLVGGGIAAATAGFLGASGVTAASAGGPGGGRPGHPGGPGGPGRGLLGFTEVPTSTADTFVVPAGYTFQVIVPWGTPLARKGPAWKKDASNSAADQAVQVGMHHDGMHFFPTGRGSAENREGLLVVNHEYVDQGLLFPDGGATITPEKVAKALAAHGVSVIAMQLQGGKWVNVDSRYNRRITGATPVTFSGPVSGRHPELAANTAPQGTLNNCANGWTPWGTYLTCEENWNGYFGTTDAAWSPNAAQSRYGVGAASGYNWHTADPRFDVARNPKELNRFGWVVEIDPFDPKSTPVKRTALGRIKHEGATVVEQDDRIVVYTGDDENGEYLYKFVGSQPWRRLRREGRSPLDHGTLYVATFGADGSGTWVPLVFGKGPLTASAGFADQADVLLRTRQAADAVGATKLDRPEWVAVHPKSHEVFVTLTNGSNGPTPANPRANNIYGHILRFREKGNDNTALSFTWDVAFYAGDPSYQPEGASVPANQPLFGSPDGLWVDRDGRLFIQTDVSNSSQNLASRKHDRIGNNQMLVADPGTGEIRRFLTGPRGCEITGITATPDGTSLFVNVQHPGESTPAFGAPTPENPRAVSNWPDFDPAGRPRAATVVIRRRDGGKIGT